MFTVCPKCALTLVVTAADLRVAQGYVRCGRCLNVFNALARLSEERPAAAPEPPPHTTAAGSPEQATPPEPSTPSSTAAGSPQQAASPEASAPSSAADDTGEIEIELDPSVVVTSTRAPAPEETAEQEAQVDGQSGAAAVAETSQPVPASTSVTETRTPASTEPVPMSREEADASSAPSPNVASEQAAGNPLGAEPLSQAPRELAVQPAVAESSSSVEAPDAQQTNTPEQQSEGSFELETQPPPAGLAWRLGAGALVIALALQLVNHYRDSLAATPALRGPLRTVYSALGVKLAPRWDIHAYDVRQLGASVASAAAGEIVVRASVKNSASHAQPLPLLRVTLQDRFGNRIAARDVPPVDYLPSSAAPGSLLAAGGRVDATMVFVDPGPQAVGFEIDACLRQRSGEVACAHGP